MILQRIIWLVSIVRTDNWTHGAAGRHSTVPISHTRSSPPSSQATTHCADGWPDWVDLDGWLHIL